MTGPADVTLSYTYAGALPLQQAWDFGAAGIAGSVERSYDGRLRLATETVNYADPITFSYDNDGLLNGAGAMTLTRDPDHGMVTGSQLGDVVDLTEHNDFGEVSHYAASEGINVLLDILYDRDRAGRIKKKTETVIGGAGPVATYYKYDSRGRLYRVCSSDVCGTGDVLSEYLYGDDPNDPNDPGHNSDRTGGFTSAGSITATYDDHDRLPGYNGSTYTYTENGELATKTHGDDTTSYVYDALSNLRQAVITDASTTPDTVTTIEYVVDGQNRWIGKKVNGVIVQGFLYENQLRIAAEVDGDGNVVSRFVYGEKVNVPEYMIRNGQTYHLITDHLGSPRLVVNATTGVVAQQVDYDEFGNASLVVGEWGFQPSGFAGGIYDRDTKLTRFGQRDYDAQTGRWTAKDPIGFMGKDTMLYGYVLSEPVNLMDPTGNQATLEYDLTTASIQALAKAGTVTTIALSVACLWSRAVGVLEDVLECKKEWDEAERECLKEMGGPNRGLHGGHFDLNECMKGYVSERCGGNNVDWGGRGPCG